MSKSSEFPTILLVTGWATAATVAAFVVATTGQDAPEPAPAAPIVTAEAAPEAAPEPVAETPVAEAAADPGIVVPAAVPLGLGRPALPEEIDAWDLAVLPDGTGLPEGAGDVETGDAVFAENCASCHGDFAEGLDSWPVLAGGAGSLTDRRPVKTVGSYWPYLSTVFDYIHRSMPFGQAQTLSVDDTYAITAFLLYSNGLVEDDFTLSHENFTEIVMPNADGFYPDDRPETEYSLFRAEPCMENCRTAAPEVTKRAVEISVTPRDADGKPAGTLPVLSLVATGKTVAPAEPAAEAPAAEPAAAEPATETTGVSPAAEPASGAPDPTLIAAGETVFKKCAACHKVGEGAKTAVGPALNGVIGAAMAQAGGFNYSATLAEMGAGGGVWDATALHSFLENPKAFAPGTKMAFAGLKEPEDRDAVIAYLSTFGP